MIKLFQRVPKTPEHIFGSKQVKSVPTDTPSVVIFGGEKTIEEKHPNYYMSILQDLLPRDVNIFAIAYDRSNLLPNKTNIERKQIFKRAQKNIIVDPINKIPQDVIDLFDILITPRISDNNGKKIDFNQAIKNIQKLTIYAHCHGSVVAYHFQQLMKEKMHKLRYTKFQTVMVMQNLVVIQHAPVVPLTKNKFSTLSFVSALDSYTLQYKIVPAWILNNAENLFVSYFPKKYGNFVIAYQLSERALVEHQIDGFEFSDLLTADGMILFDVEENAIRNSIGRSKILTPAEMINGSNINFDELKSNGNAFKETIQSIALKVRRARKQARANQK